MPKPDLRSLILAHLGSELEKCERATKGTWYAVVPPKDETDPGWHPGYEDGLLDICIYGGDDGSVAAMSGQACRNYEHEKHPAQPCELEPGATLCTLGDAAELQQRANAAFIVSARSGYQASLRALKAEVERHEPDDAGGTLPQDCLACDHHRPTWPCDFLSRIAAALGVDEGKGESR